MVYFADGVIEEDFEAWIHGPVCRIVYLEYKSFGYSPIILDYGATGSSSRYIKKFRENRDESEINKIDLIDAVFEKYGILTSFQLELLSHSEKPWIDARIGLSPIDNGNNVISEQTMRDFYSKKNG